MVSYLEHSYINSVFRKNFLVHALDCFAHFRFYKLYQLKIYFIGHSHHYYISATLHVLISVSHYLTLCEVQSSLHRWVGLVSGERTCSILFCAKMFWNTSDVNELILSETIDDGKPLRNTIVSSTSIATQELTFLTTFASMYQVKSHLLPTE